MAYPFLYYSRARSLNCTTEFPCPHPGFRRRLALRRPSGRLPETRSASSFFRAFSRRHFQGDRFACRTESFVPRQFAPDAVPTTAALKTKRLAVSLHAAGRTWGNNWRRTAAGFLRSLERIEDHICRMSARAASTSSSCFFAIRASAPVPCFESSLSTSAALRIRGWTEPSDRLAVSPPRNALPASGASCTHFNRQKPSAPQPRLTGVGLTWNVTRAHDLLSPSLTRTVAERTSP